VPRASLKAREASAGAFQGTFTYGKRYLARKNVGALDPYHLQLTEKSLPDCFFRNEPTSLP
jgi:serine/threonine-protein kinase HipA